MNKNEKRKALQKFFIELVVQLGMGIFLLGFGGILISDLITDVRLLQNAVVMTVVGPVILSAGIAMYINFILSQKDR
jgi:ABC-type uncharacterized transport system permease subunit